MEKKDKKFSRNFYLILGLLAMMAGVGLIMWIDKSATNQFKRATEQPSRPETSQSQDDDKYKEMLRSQYESYLKKEDGEPVDAKD